MIWGYIPLFSETSIYVVHMNKYQCVLYTTYEAFFSKINTSLIFFHSHHSPRSLEQDLFKRPDQNSIVLTYSPPHVKSLLILAKEVVWWGLFKRSCFFPRLLKKDCISFNPHHNSHQEGKWYVHVHIQDHSLHYQSQFFSKIKVAWLFSHSFGSHWYQ